MRREDRETKRQLVLGMRRSDCRRRQVVSNGIPQGLLVTVPGSACSSRINEPELLGWFEQGLVVDGMSANGGVSRCEKEVFFSSSFSLSGSARLVWGYFGLFRLGLDWIGSFWFEERSRNGGLCSTLDQGADGVGDGDGDAKNESNDWPSVLEHALINVFARRRSKRRPQLGLERRAKG